MQKVSCQLCQNTVQVERYTEHQLSIQWMEDAEAACPEFARRAGRGEHSPKMVTCPALRRTVSLAVALKQIGISPRVDPPCLPRAAGAS